MVSYITLYFRSYTPNIVEAYTTLIGLAHMLWIGAAMSESTVRRLYWNILSYGFQYSVKHSVIYFHDPQRRDTELSALGHEAEPYIVERC